MNSTHCLRVRVATQAAPAHSPVGAEFVKAKNSTSGYTPSLGIASREPEERPGSNKNKNAMNVLDVAELDLTQLTSR